MFKCTNLVAGEEEEEEEEEGEEVVVVEEEVGEEGEEHSLVVVMVEVVIVECDHRQVATEYHSVMPDDHSEVSLLLHQYLLIEKHNQDYQRHYIYNNNNTHFMQ